MAPQRSPQRANSTPTRRPAAVTLATARKAPPAAPAPSPVRLLQQRLGNQGMRDLVARTRPGAGSATAPRASAAATPAAAAPVAVKPPQARSQAPGPSPAAGEGAGPKRAVEGKEPSAPAAAPDAREALAPAIAAVRQRAGASRRHQAPGVAVASAQAAAKNPEVERGRSAAGATVAALDDAKTGEIHRDQFKERLRKAIDEATPRPQNADEAKQVMEKGGSRASVVLSGAMTAETQAAKGELGAAAGHDAPPSSRPEPAVDLRPEPAGAPLAPVSAESVAPAPLPPERLDYSADRESADRAMAENKITEHQMREGNDPAFGPALQARDAAEKHEAEAPAAYRQAEAGVQDQARAAAALTLAQGLTAMRGVREGAFGKVGVQQQTARDKDAQERKRITDAIVAIKDRTRADVETTLASMETDAGQVFEAGLKRAEKVYEDAFEEAKGGVGTWLTTWGDDWDALIQRSLNTARVRYMEQVDKAINDVAALVENRLGAARRRVAEGRAEVKRFVEGLDAGVRQLGDEALQAVSADFDAMGGEIDQRRDGLVNKLTERYKASYERMSATEQRLRDENKSLWRRVYDATIGVIQRIREFGNMLLGLLGRASGVVVDILAHPVRFLGNLVTGLMGGLKNFVSKVGTYLQKGLMDWLFGALGGAGLVMPESFDLKGIMGLILQILGITHAYFRARAVAILGEPVVAAIEKTADVFVTLATQGAAGLWRFIKDQLANLKSMVVDAIFDFVKERVIMAGITWIIGLLNPASAFFKACKAIYDIIMFFVSRGRQLATLVEAVVDSMTSIARGAIGAAATLVENALARAVPFAIGGLASLLGLGDPATPVRNLIHRAQAPVNRAMDWVIGLAVKGVKAAGRWARGLVGKKDDKKDDEHSRSLKASIGRELAGKKVSTLDEEQALLESIYSRYAPKGLKGIKFEERGSRLAVIVSASAADEVANLDLTRDDHRKRLLQIVRRLRYLVKGSTYILVYYNGEHFRDIKNHRQHAETVFVNKTVGQLRKRMIKDIAQGKLRNNGSVTISWDMSRSPCLGCADVRVANVVPLLKAAPLEGLDIRLEIKASAVEGQTGYPALEKLLEPGNPSSIEIKATDVWDAIRAKIAQYPAFFDFDTLMTYRFDEFGDYKSKAFALQAAIDEVVAANKKKTKDMQKGDV